MVSCTPLVVQSNAYSFLCSSTYKYVQKIQCGTSPYAGADVKILKQQTKQSSELNHADESLIPETCRFPGISVSGQAH
jgi:hypothetical protein